METSRAARVTAAAAASAAAAAPPLPPSPARPDPLPAALARLTSPDCEAVPVRRAPIKGPSGPRRQGEGVEEEEQAVLSADKLANGGLQLRVTLLAAGFVIGASGSSVREIAAATGAVVQSWSEPSAPGLPRPTRVFRVQGQPRAVAAAAELIGEAVQRYRDLCESKRRGEFVQRQQRIRGVEFSYQPPPRASQGGEGRPDSAAPSSAASTASSGGSPEPRAPRSRRGRGGRAERRLSPPRARPEAAAALQPPPSPPPAPPRPLYAPQAGYTAASAFELHPPPFAAPPSFADQFGYGQLAAAAAASAAAAYPPPPFSPEPRPFGFGAATALGLDPAPRAAAAQPPGFYGAQRAAFTPPRAVPPRTESPSVPLPDAARLLGSALAGPLLGMSLDDDPGPPAPASPVLARSARAPGGGGWGAPAAAPLGGMWGADSWLRPLPGASRTALY